MSPCIALAKVHPNAVGTSHAIHNSEVFRACILTAEVKGRYLESMGLVGITTYAR